MTENEIAADFCIDDILSLYERNVPDIVLYSNEMTSKDQCDFVDSIAKTEEQKALNPLSVVLESFVNIMTEKFSVDQLTQSEMVTFIDNSSRRLAIEKLLELSDKNPMFLKELHDKWLVQVGAFIKESYRKGINNINELVFLVGLKFRISAASSTKAIQTIIKPIIPATSLH